MSFTRGWGGNIFFKTSETENRAPNSSVKGSGANHYPRAPARYGRMYEESVGAGHACF